MSHSSVLFVAAFPPELAAIATSSPSADTAAVGIGLVAASRGAALAIEHKQPRSVVMVGTCGAYPGSGLSIGDVIVAPRVGLVSSAAARGEGALLSSMSGWIEPDAAMTRALHSLGAVSAVVATTLAITTDDGLARLLRERHACDVEHLEAYAVALACEAARIPFACVLGVTNAVGAQGREQWKEHRERVETSVGELILRWIALPTNELN